MHSQSQPLTSASGVWSGQRQSLVLQRPFGGHGLLTLSLRSHIAYIVPYFQQNTLLIHWDDSKAKSCYLLYCLLNASDYMLSVSGLILNFREATPPLAEVFRYICPQATGRCFNRSTAGSRWPSVNSDTHKGPEILSQTVVVWGLQPSSPLPPLYTCSSYRCSLFAATGTPVWEDPLPTLFFVRG